MTSRLLISAELHRALKRQTRRADGALYGVCTLRDSDRGEVRFWSAYVNSLELIERIERLRVGEPVAVTGPFAFRIKEGGAAPEIENRITITGILDTKPPKPKGKRQIASETRVKSNEADDAPRDPEPAGDAPLNDDLPW